MRIRDEIERQVITARNFNREAVKLQRAGATKAAHDFRLIRDDCMSEARQARESQYVEAKA